MGNRNIRLVDISKATNNAVSTVSTWRRGRYPRSADTIRKLAEIFSVSPEYLLYGKCDGNEIIFSNETQTDFYKTSNPTEENIRRHLEAVIEDCEGDKIILTSFGAGFIWGSVYLKWGYDPKDVQEIADMPADNEDNEETV